MAIFNSYVCLPDGNSHQIPLNHHFPMVFLWFSPMALAWLRGQAQRATERPTSSASELRNIDGKSEKTSKIIPNFHGVLLPICSMVLESLPTKLDDFVRANLGKYHIHGAYGLSWFTGWWLNPTSLKNRSLSIGMMTFPIYGNIKHVPNHQPAMVYGWHIYCQWVKVLMTTVTNFVLFHSSYPMTNGT